MTEDRPGIAAPGMSNLNAEQSLVTEQLFEQRYVSIQQKPVLGRAEQRRLFRAATGRKRP